MLDGHAWAMLLRTAYLAVHRAADAVMALHRLTADQFVLLTLLAECDGVMQQDLVRRSGSDPNTVRAMLVLLERRGLVRRRAHADDGRARSVELTARGRSLQTTLWKTSAALRSRVTAAIPAGARSAMEAALRSLAAIADVEATPTEAKRPNSTRRPARRKPTAASK
ncbi:MAG: MarR family transcriptional regulator [Pirellula sp.]|nr:MarR family transcriptional regulator [Pirellula sp.]